MSELIKLRLWKTTFDINELFDDATKYLTRVFCETSKSVESQKSHHGSLRHINKTFSASNAI